MLLAKVWLGCRFCASFLSCLERPVFHVLYSKYTFFWHILLVTMRESTNVKLDQSAFVAKKICYTWLELCLNSNPSAGVDIVLHCEVMWKHCRNFSRLDFAVFWLFAL